MKIDPNAVEKIRNRQNDISEWLADEAPYTCVDQKHLDANTPERAYWHHGYCAALNDVLRLLNGQINQTADNGDTSS